MKRYLFGLITPFLFFGCSQKHQINIGKISLKKSEVSEDSIVKEHYMSFTQEYYDNKLYPVSEYCDDKRAYLTDDKFSTETYLKITNERTKQSRVGKYPIWFLLNDDAGNISCVKKSANFINAEPFIVSKADTLSVKLLQKNEAEKGVPVRELGVLMDFISLVVPRTANFLLRANNIIKDPITQNYLNMMDNAFRHGDLDGTKSRNFTTDVSSIKVMLNVPEEDHVVQELGYILLKPKYRTTLTTVDLVNGIPDFRFIYSSIDPRIEDIMSYKLKSKNVEIRLVVDNFRQVSSEHLVDALISLNTHLMNRFTRYDRALILSLALRQSDLYKKIVNYLKMKQIKPLKEAMKILSSSQNPLHDLSEELKSTGCDYYGVMHQAYSMIKQSDADAIKLTHEEEQRRASRQRAEIALQGIENFLRPVSRWNYIPQMFSSNATITETSGRVLTLENLQQNYNRENNVSEYGCFTNLHNKIGGISVQEYLIHPNYSNNVIYDYMALSVDKHRHIDTIFYKFISGANMKIEKILIDKNSQLVMKSRLYKVLQREESKSCSNNIMRQF
jgi:hypothetical protein